MVVTLKRRDAAAKETRIVPANREPAINPGILNAGGKRLQDLKARTKKVMIKRYRAPRNSSQGFIPAERAPKKRSSPPPQRPGMPKKKAEKDKERKIRSLSPAGRRWRRLEPGQ
jgi:hypothetical protein